MATDADPRRWLALTVLLTGAFLPILDFNVVNLALPEIRRSLGATSSDTQFVISAYAATYAVFLITGGRLGDWLGRKRMFMLGVTGFTLASVLCGCAWSPSALIAGRIFQGLTATVMAPQVLASIRVLFPPAEQSTALGLYGAVFGLANIVGQILGGALVTLHPLGLTWQAIFFINVPIGAIALLGSVWFLRDSHADRAQRLDSGGVIRLCAALGLLVYPLIEGREAGWPAWTLLMFPASALSLLEFVRYEHRLARRGGAPLVDLTLFRERGLAIGMAMALLYYMLSSFYLTFSVYLQGGLHLTPLDAGLRTLPFAVGYFVASFGAGRVMRLLGARALTLGFAIQVLGFGTVIGAVATQQPRLLEVGLAVAGLGYGIVMPSIIKSIIGGMAPKHAGLASGVVISTFQIGAALGVAIIGGVFYGALGTAPNGNSYAHAFILALSCNVVLLAMGGLLSLWLPAEIREPASLDAARDANPGAAATCTPP